MKKIISLLLVAVLTVSMLASCDLFDVYEPTEKITIGVMAGPTGMGMAKLINDNGGLQGNEKYAFVKYDNASIATADLLAKKVDMLCLPTNTAAILYNAKGESIQTLALNCLNSLYIMTKTGTVIENLEDLEGKTIYTIENGTPATILRHLLAQKGINATVKTTIGEGENEKKIDKPTDLAPLLIGGKVDIALVPEPVATAAPLKIQSQTPAKDYNYTVAVKLTDAWEEISDSPVAMGCIVANKEFITSNKRAVNKFLDEYKESIEFISDPENSDTAAKYVVDATIMDAVPAAKKSLSNLGSVIAYKDGSDMKTILTDFYNAIGKNMIGGKLPSDEFYYKK